MALDNYDMYNNDDETTSETSSLQKENAADDELEEAYVPDSGGGGSKHNNRIFVIALGVLAAVFIIAIIAMILFASINLPRRQQAMTQTAFAISMGNEATINAATATADAFLWTATPTETEVPATPTETLVVPTATQEVVVQATEEAEPTQDSVMSQAQTATISALLTQVAAQATATEEVLEPTPNAAQLTATAQAALDAEVDELPDTGFMDDGGLYYVAGSALVLMAVIFIVRRLRKA